MDNCFGIINHTTNEADFGSLCKNRPVYMLPFASRYRIVDVAISNMVNNGIKSIAVYTGEKIRSTMDHLSDGKSWGLNSRFQGLFLYPPIKQNLSIERLGDIAELYSTLDFFETLREENALILDPSVIFMNNLDEAYNDFVESESDITLLYVKISDDTGEFVNTDKLHLDDDDFVNNIGINLGTETLKINSFELTGLVQIVKDPKSYFNANLNLLKKENFNELFCNNGRVMTKTKDEPPTIYREFPKVENSLIANGSDIEGDVENSIIFRGVKIEKGAIVKNSIIMQKSIIRQGAVVVNSIIDKYAEIEEEVSLVGSVNQPYIVGKYGVVKKD